MEGARRDTRSNERNGSKGCDELNERKRGNDGMHGMDVNESCHKRGPYLISIRLPKSRVLHPTPVKKRRHGNLHLVDRLIHVQYALFFQHNSTF